MASEALSFPGGGAVRQPIAHLSRLGDPGHRQLGAPREAGERPFRRVVVDASKLHRQRAPLDAFPVRRLKPSLSVAEQLGVDPASLGKRLDEHCRTGETIRDALESSLHERADDLARSRPVATRRTGIARSGVPRGEAA